MQPPQTSLQGHFGHLGADAKHRSAQRNMNRAAGLARRDVLRDRFRVEAGDEEVKVGGVFHVSAGLVQRHDKETSGRNPAVFDGGDAVDGTIGNISQVVMLAAAGASQHAGFVAGLFMADNLVLAEDVLVSIHEDLLGDRVQGGLDARDGLVGVDLQPGRGTGLAGDLSRAVGGGGDIGEAGEGDDEGQGTKERFHGIRMSVCLSGYCHMLCMRQINFHPHM